jgi:hypothetical protein
MSETGKTWVSIFAGLVLGVVLGVTTIVVDSPEYAWAQSGGVTVPIVLPVQTVSAGCKWPANVATTTNTIAFCPVQQNGMLSLWLGVNGGTFQPATGLSGATIDCPTAALTKGVFTGKGCAIN